MMTVDIGLAIFGGIVLVLGLLSRWLRQTVFSENILSLAVGVLVGPLVLGLLNISAWTNQEAFLEQAARITVAIAVMEIALSLPKNEILQRIRGLVILLTVVMPIMWLTSSLLTALILGVSAWTALLIGAVVTPTDPVVASSIVSGPLAEDKLPGRIRNILSAESGANDGLALPFVMLPILVIEQSFSEAVGHWLVRSVLLEVGGAGLIGVLIGYFAGKVLLWSESKHAIDRAPFLAFTLALSLTTLGIAHLLHTDGILAVFVTGVIFHLMVRENENLEVERVQGAVDQFFSVPIFAVIGISIPWQGWLDLGWQGIILVVAILLFRRIPALLLVYRWIRPIETRGDALFLGWFGPIGVAALYYANFSLSHTGIEQVWIVASLVICSSVVIHGITAAPLIRLYGRVTEEAAKHDVY